ncbi:hypothetical protein EH359_13410 [Enterococcus faecium]|nr:hypothetical protein [Enterococcus faecium]
MNDRYPTINAPNLFLKTTLLQNFSLINFMVDWNGSNNLLTAEHKARSNAVLYGSGGGKNILVKKLIVKDLPGNQAIFFPDVDVEAVGAGSIIVEECEFLNCGSGLVGNYNTDHSTVFLSGKGDRIRNNKFKSTGTVLGSPFEIHGPNAQAYGNDVENYTIGFWIAPHVNDLKDTLVSDNLFRGVILAWGWGAGQGVGESGGYVQIRNNKFYFRDDAETYRPGDVFSIEGAKVDTKRLLVDNNEFILNTPANKVFMQVYKTKNFIFTRNKLENFNKQVILFANYNFGDAYALDSFVVDSNKIVNCGSTMDVINVENGGTGLKARVIKVNNNDIIQDAVTTTNAIRLNLPVDFGEILNNNISVNYQNPFYLFSVASSVKVRHIGDKDQAEGIYGDITSEVTNRLTGTKFTKKATNSSSWKKTLLGTAAPASGVFNVGDEVINTTPTAGGYKGWVCTASGNPGRWKGFGLIQD